MKICKLKQCNEKHSAKGLCKKHYLQVRRKQQQCEIVECNKPHHAKNLCKNHYNRMWEADTGKPRHDKTMTKELWQILKNCKTEFEVKTVVKAWYNDKSDDGEVQINAEPKVTQPIKTKVVSDIKTKKRKKSQRISAMLNKSINKLLDNKIPFDVPTLHKMNPKLNTSQISAWLSIERKKDNLDKWNIVQMPNRGRALTYTPKETWPQFIKR